MIMETFTNWIGQNLKIVFFALFAQILLSGSSPLSKDSVSDSSACSKGWIHYKRFCVTPAVGESDAAVARHCYGFGGIGIKGYCITKIHNTASHVSNSLEDVLIAEAVEKGENNIIGDLVHTSDRGDELKGDFKDIESTVACPEGWTHYGKICVYKPLSIEEQCHHLHAVEFSGLCLKHADTDAIAQRPSKYSSSDKEKRVCCCPHVSAKSNGYGCL